MTHSSLYIIWMTSDLSYGMILKTRRDRSVMLASSTWLLFSSAYLPSLTSDQHGSKAGGHGAVLLERAVCERGTTRTRGEPLAALPTQTTRPGGMCTSGSSIARCAAWQKRAGPMAIGRT